MNSVDDFVQAVHEPPPPGSSKREVTPEDKPVIWGSPTSLDAQDVGSRLGIDMGEPSIKAAMQLLESGDPTMVKEALHYLGTGEMTKEALLGSLGLRAAGWAAKGLGKAGLFGAKHTARGIGKIAPKMFRGAKQGGKMAWKGLSSKPGMAATTAAGVGMEAQYLRQQGRLHGVGRRGTQMGQRRGFFG